MPYRQMCFVLLIALPCADAAPVPKRNVTTEEQIEKLFGKATIPDKDYLFTLEDEALRIRVPEKTLKWEKPQDGFSVPRVAQEVKGDFTAIVQIRLSDFPEKAEVKSVTAGIFVMGDVGTYLEHSRVQMNQFNQKGKRVRQGILHTAQNGNARGSAGSGGGAFDPDRTYHKLERVGGKVSAYASADGKGWHKLGTWDLELDETAKVGLFVGHEGGPCFVEFAEFKITPTK